MRESSASAMSCGRLRLGCGIRAAKPNAESAMADATGQTVAPRPVGKGELLAFALVGGVFGAHKFYLGKYWQGILYFIFSWTLIPGFIALIEFLVYLFTKPASL